MSRYANLQINIQCVGGTGRRDTICRTPLALVSQTLTTNPSALSSNTPSELSYIQFQAGYNTVALPNSFTQNFPILYVVIAPPTTSTNGKLLMGNAADVGVSLVPNLPMVLAVGPQVTSFGIQSQFSENCDWWVI
jgi:hypothetical protein